VAYTVPSPALSGTTRRAVLAAAAGTAGLSAVRPASAGGDDDDGGGPTPFCPDASFDPNHVHCQGASAEGCADDHPATREIRAAVEESLRHRYPNVGTLVREGYIPYFDVVRPGEDGGYSHWLNPEYIGDDATLDPERPESVLVDNEWWRPIGVMFIATDDGDRFVPPPPVYRTEGDGGAGDEGDDGGATKCSPWHYHDGVPARFAWWFYRKVYGDAIRKAVEAGEFEVPCVTPCMMHVWTYPNPHGVYAHHPPPRGNRGGPPAENPGFDTDARPGRDDLDWDALPNDLAHRARPDGVPETLTDGWLGDRLDW